MELFKHILKNFPLLLLLIVFVSCEKNNNDIDKAEVKFTINNSGQFQNRKDLKDSSLPLCSDLTPTHVKVKLQGPQYPVGRELTLKLLEGKGVENETEAISLTKGTYKVLFLKVYSKLIEKDSLILISPKEGSEYENEWNLRGVYSDYDESEDDDNGTFEVREFTKSYAAFDVLCFEPSDYSKYGF